MRAMTITRIRSNISEMRTEVEKLDAKIEQIENNFSVTGSKRMVTTTLKGMRPLVNKAETTMKHAEIHGIKFPLLEGVVSDIFRVIKDLKRHKDFLNGTL